MNPDNRFTPMHVIEWTIISGSVYGIIISKFGKWKNKNPQYFVFSIDT